MSLPSQPSGWTLTPAAGLQPNVFVIRKSSLGFTVSQNLKMKMTVVFLKRFYFKVIHFTYGFDCQDKASVREENEEKRSEEVDSK